MDFYFTSIWSKSMPFFSRKKLSLDPPPANELPQQPRPVCTWSTHSPQCGPSPSPFPRSSHTLAGTGTVTGELFIFGGIVDGWPSSDLFVFSTRDFSTTLLETSGEDPTPRFAHSAAFIGTSTLLIYGGKMNFGDEYALNHDSLSFLNLGTSNLSMSSPTPVDHGFALQNLKNGPTL